MKTNDDNEKTKKKKSENGNKLVFISVDENVTI